MKLNTFIELLTLSTSLYAISKDDKLMADIQNLTEKGKDNLDKFIKDISNSESDEYDVDGDQQAVGKVLQKAIQIKNELDHKLEELVEKAYEKMHIVHTKEIELLNNTVNQLKTDLDDKDQRIKILESKLAK